MSKDKKKGKHIKEKKPTISMIDFYGIPEETLTERRRREEIVRWDIAYIQNLLAEGKIGR